MPYDKSTLNTNTDHIPEPVRDDLAFAKQWILDKSSTDIAMIWLFGSYARGDFINDRRVDENGVISEYNSDVDVLVVFHGESSTTKERKLTALLGKLQGRAELSAPFHLIQESAERFNSALQQGEYFYQDIVKEGVVLWDDNFDLASPQELTNPQRRELSIRYFERFFEKASQFHGMFEFNYQRKQRVAAIYNLHQMTEHLFATYLATITLYKPRTHRLFVLRNEVKKLDRHIRKIFPINHEQDNKLFAFLCDAYIDARYKEHYSVDTEVLDRLVGWVESFQHWVHAECLQAIDGFVPDANYSQGFEPSHPLMDFEALKVRPLVEDVLVETEGALVETEGALAETAATLEKERAEFAKQNKQALEREKQAQEREALLLKKLKDAGLE